MGAAQGLGASVCRQNWCRFRLVSNEDSNNKSCRGFTELMDKMSGQRPSRDHSTDSSWGAPAACSSQEPTLCSQSWNRSGSDGSAHTWPSIIHHRGTFVHPVRTGPKAVKCQLPALPKCTEKIPVTVQMDFWNPCVWMLQVWPSQILITVNTSTCPASSIHGIALWKQTVFQSDFSYLVCKFCWSSKEIWLMKA